MEGTKNDSVFVGEDLLGWFGHEAVQNMWQREGRTLLEVAADQDDLSGRARKRDEDLVGCYIGKGMKDETVRRSGDKDKTLRTSGRQERKTRQKGDLKTIMVEVAKRISELEEDRMNGMLGMEEEADLDYAKMNYGYTIGMESEAEVTKNIQRIMGQTRDILGEIQKDVDERKKGDVSKEYEEEYGNEEETKKRDEVERGERLEVLQRKIDELERRMDKNRRHDKEEGRRENLVDEEKRGQLRKLITELVDVSNKARSQEEKELIEWSNTLYRMLGKKGKDDMDKECGYVLLDRALKDIEDVLAKRKNGARMEEQDEGWNDEARRDTGTLSNQEQDGKGIEEDQVGTGNDGRRTSIRERMDGDCQRCNISMRKWKEQMIRMETYVGKMAFKYDNGRQCLERMMERIGGMSRMEKDMEILGRWYGGIGTSIERMEEKLEGWKRIFEEEQTKGESEEDERTSRHRGSIIRKYCHRWNKGECWNQECKYLHEEVPTCRYGADCRKMDMCMFKHNVLDRYGNERVYYQGTIFPRY